MEKHEAQNEILNDLLKINNDRIAGYEKAILEAKGLDIDLKAIFERMKEQSVQYKGELAAEIGKDDGIVEDDTTSSGKIYRAWMDIKSTFTESDRHSILVSCEFGEDAALRAYESALTSNDLVDTEARQLVANHLSALKMSHELIKQQREAHSALLK